MAKALDKPSLYDLDYVAWLEEQAAIETQLSETTFPTTLPYSLKQLCARELPAGQLPAQRKKHP